MGPCRNRQGNSGSPNGVWSTHTLQVIKASSSPVLWLHFEAILFRKQAWVHTQCREALMCEGSGQLKTWVGGTPTPLPLWASCSLGLSVTLM